MKRIYVPVAHAQAQGGLLRNLLKREDYSLQGIQWSLQQSVYDRLSSCILVIYVCFWGMSDYLGTF